jgi:hypothetical protein
MAGGLFQLLAYGAQDLFLTGALTENEIVTLTKLGKIDDIKNYLDNNDNIKIYNIRNAMDRTCDLKIKVLLASYLNKPIMKNIMDIQRKRNIWKYVFNWLTKPITNDGLLGIDVRLGLKSLKDLNEAPLTL